MSENLNLELRLTANASQLTSVLNNSSASVRNWTNHAASGFRNLGAQAGKLYQQLNGFSAISKLAAAAGGYSLLSDAMKRNLEFEKALLDMKQTAQMTAQQAAEMRRLAIEAASRNLALPTEIAAGMKAFSAAGLQYDQIKSSIEEAARAAVSFRSTVEQIALLDFDLQDKIKLDPAQIKNAHNMLLYHAKSGRYEAAPMASEAPKYLNSVASVGISGMKGLNFTGAMTQVLMKLAPATQPSEVSTFMEHGLAHITSKHQVKGLGKFGIDVKKFMPNGKFYGEGGVQGALDLAAEMKKKGLENPFKLDKAGFREMYTKKFWLQMMRYHDDVVMAMKEGDKAALDDMVGRDKAEIERSNYAKVRQFEITKEKGQVSDGATRAVGKVADLEGWAAQNPGTAVAGTAIGAIGMRLLWKKMMGGGSALEKAIGAAGGAGMPVSVTNWPAGLGGPMKASERLAGLPGRAAAGAGAAEAAAAGAGGGAALSAAAGIGMVAAPAALAYAAKSYFESDSGQRNRAKSLGLELQRLETRLQMQKGPGYQDKQMIAQLEKQIGQMRADRDAILARLERVANRPVEVYIEGRHLVSAVNSANGRDARRQ
jgi:hypothetical protein